MSQSQLHIEVKIDPGPFHKTTKWMILHLWRDLFGWRRFFIIDWWLVKLGFTPTKFKRFPGGTR